MQPAFGSSIDQFVNILWKRFKQRPLLYLQWYLSGKPYYFWSWDIIQGQGDIYVYPVTKSLYQQSWVAAFSRTVMKLLHPVLLVISLIGVPLSYLRFRSIKNNNIQKIPVLLLLSILGYFTLLYMVFPPWPRYSIPLRPALYLWAIWSCHVIAEFISSSGRTHAEGKT